VRHRNPLQNVYLLQSIVFTNDVTSDASPWQLTLWRLQSGLGISRIASHFATQNTMTAMHSIFCIAVSCNSVMLCDYSLRHRGCSAACQRLWTDNVNGPSRWISSRQHGHTRYQVTLSRIQPIPFSVVVVNLPAHVRDSPTPLQHCAASCPGCNAIYIRA